MKIDIGRRGQIGIIDLAAFNALICWTERYRSNQITEGEPCHNAEIPSQSPPAPITDGENGSPGPVVGTSDRSQDQATDSEDPISSSGLDIAQSDPRRGGQR
jgi:hypothetical protein